MATLYERISRAYCTGLYSQRQLSNQFGVSKGLIYYIVNGRGPRNGPKPNLDPVVGEASLFDIEATRLRKKIGALTKPRLGENYIDPIDGTVRRYEGPRKPGKLTALQVREIRQRYGAEKGLTQVKLSRQYGVTPLAIGNVLRGKSWPEV
jgi:transcriptional regulator with XRE-family HTH domain